MPKIIDYELEFIPERVTGIIRFHVEGKSAPYILPNVPLADFTALSVLFTTGHVQALQRSFKLSWSAFPSKGESSLLDDEDLDFEVPDRYK